MSEFDSPNEMLGWAEADIQQLHAVCSDVFTTGKAVMVIDTDAQTGNKTYKYVFDKPIPSEAKKLTVSAILNCRHALDQACVAAWRTMNLGEVPDRLYFPITNSSRDLEGRMKATPLDVLAPIHGALRKARPYPTIEGGEVGNDAIVALSDSAQRKHTINPKILGRVMGWEMHKTTIKGMIGTLGPSIWNVENNELIIGTTTANGSIDMNVSFTFDITVSGSGKMDGRPLIESLLAIYSECRGTVALIEGAFR